MRLIDLLHGVDLINFKTKVWHDRGESYADPSNRHVDVNSMLSQIKFRIKDEVWGTPGCGIEDIVAIAGLMLKRLNTTNHTASRTLAVDLLAQALKALNEQDTQ